MMNDDRRAALFDLVDWIAERIVREALAEGRTEKAKVERERLDQQSDDIGKGEERAIGAPAASESPDRSEVRTQQRTRRKKPPTSG